MKTEQAKETISARMAARQTEAREKITGMLWEPKPDLEAVANVALASGIAPAEVDKLALAIEAGRAELQAAVEADKALPELRKQQTAAKSEAERTAAALAAADAADDAARGALAEIEEAIYTATRAREAAAQLMLRGTLPRDRAPAFAREVAAAWEADQKQTEIAGRLSVMKGQVRWRENRVEGLARELEDEKKSDLKQAVVSTGKMVTRESALEARLATEKTALKEAQAELKRLEKAAAA